MNTDLKDARVAFLATDGFEESELAKPKKAVEDAGATAHIVSPEKGQIKAWAKDDWGSKYPVDKTLDDARPEDYDALVLPGGQINPDLLRIDGKALDFIRHFVDAGKPVAAICHGPWTLIEIGAVKGRRMTSYKSIQTDMKNAGANWVDEPLVEDGNFITSRKPDDLPAFSDAIVRALRERVAEPA